LILDFLSQFSPRLRAVLALLREVMDMLVTVEDILHDKGSDPKVQKALNKMRDIRRKFDTINGFSDGR
jgi:hypothetical protein